MRDSVLVRIGKSLAYPADGASRPPSEPFVGSRGRDLVNRRVAAQVGINPTGQCEQPLTDLPLLVEITRQARAFPRARVRNASRSSRPGGRPAPLQVAGRRDRDEHVVAVTQRSLVVVHELVMRESLVGHLVVRNAQEDDNGAALRRHRA